MYKRVYICTYVLGLQLSIILAINCSIEYSHYSSTLQQNVANNIIFPFVGGSKTVLSFLLAHSASLEYLKSYLLT